MMENQDTPETLKASFLGSKNKLLDSAYEPEFSAQDDDGSVHVKDASFGDIKDVSTVLGLKGVCLESNGCETGCVLSSASGRLVGTVDENGRNDFIVANPEQSGDILEDAATTDVLEGRDNCKLICNGNVNNCEQNEKEAAVESVDAERFDFLTGDVVWVKTKNQNWWPGKVYDPSNESDSAVKNEPGDNILVGYFGSNHVIRCNRSQLRPFHEYQEQLLALNKSRSFPGAVDKAVEEFGKCVKREMTCSCVSKECRNKLGRFGEFSVNHFEPESFLSQLKSLTKAISELAVIERVVMVNRLSSFYCWIGHKQLPIDQLGETIDAKDIHSDGLISKKKSTKKCSDFKHVKAFKSRKAVIGNVDVKMEMEESEFENLDDKSCHLDSLGKREEEASGIANGDGAGKQSFDKGSYFRERKRSRYLSYPYVSLARNEIDQTSPNVSFKGINSNSPSGHVTGSNSLCRSGCRKFMMSWYENVISENKFFSNPAFENASLAEFLFELCSVAVDCTHPMNNMDFDLFQWFFSKFRVSAYQDESAYEMYCRSLVGKHKDTVSKSQQLDVNPGAASLDVEEDLSSSLVQDSVKMDSHVYKTVVKKEKVYSGKHNTKLPSGASDVNIEIEIAGGNILFTDCMQKSTQVKETAGATILPMMQNSEIPDLNNSNVSPSLLPQGPPILGDSTCQGSNSKPRKRKRKGESSQLSTATPAASSSYVAEANAAEFGSLVIDLGPGAHLCDNLPPASDFEQGLSFSTLDSELTLAQSKVNPTAVLSNSTTDSAQNKKKENVRKRKYEKSELACAAVIPDLNGSSINSKSPGKESLLNNGSSPQPKSGRKRKNGDSIKESGIETNTTEQTKLHLQFGSGALLPSKEDLISRFSSFGTLKESEMHLSKRSSSVQVAFARKADAEEAYRSLGKHNPFSASLVSYQLQHLHTTQPPAPGFPKSTLASSDGPPIDFIRQNLQMMTTMLENAGDNISPAMRAKLEDEIKTLLNKVSSTHGEMNV